MAEASGPPGLFSYHHTDYRLGRQALSAGPAAVPPPDGPWVDAWLSPERLSRYVAAADGDRARALALYEWNAQVSAALQRDLGHLEIALRNAYDTAAGGWSGPGHWLRDDADKVFAPLWRTKHRGPATPGRRQRIDVNRKPRRLVERAVEEVGGRRATPGKVVAQLSFGFWRYLSSSAHEKTLWVPMLHRAFPPGTDRAVVDAQVDRLYGIRNRIAHHEHLLRVDLSARLSELLTIAGQLSPELRAHLTATSSMQALIAERP